VIRRMLTHSFAIRSQPVRAARISRPNKFHAVLELLTQQSPSLRGPPQRTRLSSFSDGWASDGPAEGVAMLTDTVRVFR
jgi:hypothetical protein